MFVNVNVKVNGRKRLRLREAADYRLLGALKNGSGGGAVTFKNQA